VIQLTDLSVLIENKLCDVTSLSISGVDHIFIMLSPFEPVINNYESSDTATVLTALLCSYKVVISLPDGLQLFIFDLG
jgi:hypothetical protein